MKSNSRNRLRPDVTRKTRWIFRLIALVLLPLLIVIGAEVSLRLIGYGHSTSFFKRIRIGSQDYFVENDKFGLSFFPPELARSPAPVAMEASKPPGTFRIFVLGESAALGDPRPAYGAGRYLQALLSDRFPAIKFEVICGAVTAINSHAILPIARECAQHQGDLWIVYMGNNEMIGPFGAASVFGSRSPPLAYVRIVLAIQRTRLGQYLMALARRLSIGHSHQSSWAGMRMFLENQVEPLDKRREIVYAGFQRNLKDILQSARHAGVPTILSTVAVNLKDCAPFASIPATNWPGSERTLYETSLRTGADAQAAGRYGQAAENYARAAELIPLSAEAQFRLASVLLQQTNSSAALDHFERACDFDNLPFRADSTINRIIRTTAIREANSRLVFNDIAAVVASNSPAGIVGREFFYEHVHFNFDGNYVVARAWAEQVSQFLPPGATNGNAQSWAAQEVCERRLGLTDWNRFSVLQDMETRLSQPPFTAQADHREQMEILRSSIRELRGRMNKADTNGAAEIYRAALLRTPEDHRLHENYAEFLDLTGNLPAAITEWERVTELIPQHHLAYFQTGRLWRRLGKLEDAQAWMRKSLALRPDLSEGWLELGNMQQMQGKLEDALVSYANARELTPQDYRVYYHTGKALSKLHQASPAITNFQEAVRLYPRYWEARYALGEELAFANRTADARFEFEQVTKEKPDYALAHLNLGVALVKMGEPQAALLQFEETLRLDPQNKMVPAYIERLRGAKELR